VLGDIIVAADGEPVTTADDLLHLFEKRGVGAQTRLKVERDGESREIRLELIALR
jgi:S1-C subfamily serine protease